MKTVIKCSNCGTELVNILQNPNINLDITANIVVHCWKCKDKSFPVTISGDFFISATDSSGIGVIDMDDNFDTIVKTTGK